MCDLVKGINMFWSIVYKVAKVLAAGILELSSQWRKSRHFRDFQRVLKHSLSLS